MFELPSGSNLALAGPTPWSFAGDDYSGDEEFAAPHAPRFLTVERSCEALGPKGAAEAQRLGQLDIGWRLGEEELWVVDPARKLLRCCLVTCQEGVEDADCHGVHLLWTFVDRTGLKRKPRIPVRESAAWRCRPEIIF
jgi:hypothetical protein